MVETIIAPLLGASIFVFIGFFIGITFAYRKSPSDTQGGWPGTHDFELRLATATPIRRIVSMPLGNHSPAEFEEEWHPDVVEVQKVVSMYWDETIGFRDHKTDDSEYQIPLIEVYSLAKKTSMVARTADFDWPPDS